MQNEEFLIKNACYSPAKYYLCKQNNKRSLLGRKQRSQVVRSFLNRYQFSCISKVTSLFSIRYTLINILNCNRWNYIRYKYLRHFKKIRIIFQKVRNLLPILGASPQQFHHSLGKKQIDPLNEWGEFHILFL